MTQQLLVAMAVLLTCSCSDKKEPPPERATNSATKSPVSAKPAAKAQETQCPDGSAPKPMRRGEPYIVDLLSDSLDTVRCILWEGDDFRAVFTLTDNGEPGDESGVLAVTVNGAKKALGQYSYNTGTGGAIIWQISSDGDLVFVSEEGGSGADPGSTTALRIARDKGQFAVTEWTDFGDDEGATAPPKWVVWSGSKPRP